jgi:hypothetical protein
MFNAFWLLLLDHLVICYPLSLLCIMWFIFNIIPFSTWYAIWVKLKKIDFLKCQMSLGMNSWSVVLLYFKVFWIRNFLMFANCNKKKHFKCIELPNTMWIQSFLCIHYKGSFLTIHVEINLNGNHVKKYGIILKKDWIHNGLLIWWCYICHTVRMKNVDSKNVFMSKQKLKIKTSLNEFLKIN